MSHLSIFFKGNMSEEPSFVNRLKGEKSPYLRQHAYNPVDWYPWGEKAFERARDEDKPIFLSIGYATCHWCHIMAHESFEDGEVASALNDAFVCIKIDREELPEIDSLYMELAQTMIWGAAGWPLNLILTPDLKPFFAATYLPKRSSKGLIGVIELAEKIKGLWGGDERERLMAQASKMIDILGSHIHLDGTDIPLEESIEQTAEILFKIADPVWGGMQGAPKFPLGYQSNFLIHYYLRSKDARALFLVEKTLGMMHRGGIYDHLGGGFHRYSVDKQWHIPHFEKMLYDNAILSYAYLEAWKSTRNSMYKDVCKDILNYIARDMQHFEGGFYSAEDADSEGKEGFFYTWTRQEVVDLLGEENGGLLCDFYNIFDHGLVEGRSVPYLNCSFEEFAENYKIDPEVCRQMIDEARSALFKKRCQRVRPFRDEKIITSWNGLMINAFAEAGFTFDRKDYSSIAVRAAQFIKDKLWINKELVRRFCDGESKGQANLDDYAFLIKGLLSLFETGQGRQWLEWAIELAEVLEQKFRFEGGAFYQAASDSEHLLIRKSHFSDGAEPSGNAVHTENLLRLYQITSNRKYLLGAECILKAVNKFVNTYPLGYCYHLIAMQRYYDKNKATCFIVLNNANELQSEIYEALANKSPSHHVFVWLCHGDNALEKLVGAVDKPCQKGKTTLYVCHEGACKAPVTGKKEILDAIEAM